MYYIFIMDLEWASFRPLSDFICSSGWFTESSVSQRCLFEHCYINHGKICWTHNLAKSRIFFLFICSYLPTYLGHMSSGPSRKVMVLSLTCHLVQLHQESKQAFPSPVGDDLKHLPKEMTRRHTYWLTDKLRAAFLIVHWPSTAREVKPNRRNCKKVPVLCIPEWMRRCNLPVVCC